MADEMNEGTAYLRALKQSTGAQSGAAAAPAREQDRLIDNLSTVQGSESFQGAEKRRSPATNAKAAPSCARRDATSAPGPPSPTSA
jgi:hypothetical protein